MAFNTNTSRASYIATAGQTVFPFTFKIFTDTNITVYKNQVALVLSTNYTVTINGDSGGSVTLLAGASLNDEIVIVRSLAITRDFDYQDNGDFFADTVDSDQDYQTYLVQDVDAKFLRTFKLPDAISGTVSSELPLPVNDAYIRWNSDSTAIINDTTIPNAVIEATTQATTATTKAGEASTSASNALGYRNEAEGFRDEAEAFAISIDPNTVVSVSIHASTSKTTPADADEIGITDSASSFSLKKLTWANLKATLLTYFDTLYSRTASIFGVGQTWQDVTGNRVKNTVYTNTDGKPRFVFISIINGATNGMFFNLFINGAKIGWSGGLGNDYSNISFIVPSGATYECRDNIGGGTINIWSEVK